MNLMCKPRADSTLFLLCLLGRTVVWTGDWALWPLPTTGPLEPPLPVSSKSTKNFLSRKCEFYNFSWSLCRTWLFLSVVHLGLYLSTFPQASRIPKA